MFPNLFFRWNPLAFYMARLWLELPVKLKYTYTHRHYESRKHGTAPVNHVTIYWQSEMKKLTLICRTISDGCCMLSQKKKTRIFARQCRMLLFVSCSSRSRLRVRFASLVELLPLRGLSKIKLSPPINPVQFASRLCGTAVCMPASVPEVDWRIIRKDRRKQTPSSFTSFHSAARVGRFSQLSRVTNSLSRHQLSQIITILLVC